MSKVRTASAVPEAAMRSCRARAARRTARRRSPGLASARAASSSGRRMKSAGTCWLAMADRRIAPVPVIRSGRMGVDDLRTGTWVTYAGGRAAGMRVRRCRIEVVAGADAGLVRDIEASVIRIGARRGNDLQLSDTKVSGLHCEIRLDDRGYRLRDLDSTNGTYVSVSYTHLRAHETGRNLVCRLLL